ncbi:MAG: iron-containing alcohol dehydrogenase family protein [bacterium]|nr:iron-containing alcohol dehydrogenase family protein [bacterium]
MTEFNLPLCMRVKEQAINEVDTIIEECVTEAHKQRAIIVSDDVIYGLYKEKMEELSEKFIESKIYLIDQSSYYDAVELGKYIAIHNIEIVIGFGGGKVLDTTKYAAYIAKKTYFCIPTSLSHDGLASPIAVLSIDDGKRKSFGCKIPAGIIVDIDIIANAPLEMLQSGIGDTLSNYTALFDWRLDQKSHGKRVNDFAYMLSDISFSSLYYNKEKSLKSKHFIKSMSESLVLSGIAMEIAGNSRPCSGSEHLFSHSLDENYKNIQISHGMAVALGSVVASILQNRDHQLLLNYLKSYDISIQPMKWGITKEVFVNAWLFAKDTRKDRYTILNEVKLTRDRLERIYDMVEEENYESINLGSGIWQ